STTAGPGSLQKKSTSATCAGANLTNSASTSAVRKFAATTPLVRWVISSRTLTRYDGDIPVVVNDPTPPASATATTKSAPATEPIGACCTGQRLPTSDAYRLGDISRN